MFNRKRLKKENEELRKRVKEFDMVLSCIPFNIFLKDTNSVYRVVSEESAKNNKMDREDMIGKSDNELFETSLHAVEFVVDDQYIIKNKVDSHSLTPYYEEGFVRYYNIYKKPYINIHGEVEGIFGMVSYSLPAMEQDLRTVLPGIDIIYDYETIVFDYDFVNKRISIVKEVEDFSESIPTLLRYPLENENYIKAHDYSKIRKGILRFDEMNSKTSEFKFLFKMKNNQNEWKNCILFSKKISTEDRIARHAIGIEPRLRLCAQTFPSVF